MTTLRCYNNAICLNNGQRDHLLNVEKKHGPRKINYWVMLLKDLTLILLEKKMLQKSKYLHISHVYWNLTRYVFYVYVIWCWIKSRFFIDFVYNTKCSSESVIGSERSWIIWMHLLLLPLLMHLALEKYELNFGSIWHFFFGFVVCSSLELSMEWTLPAWIIYHC